MDTALAFAAGTAIEAVPLPGDLLRTLASRPTAGWGELGVCVTESVRRSLRPLLGEPEDGGSENTEPGLHHPQMDSLAGPGGC